MRGRKVRRELLSLAAGRPSSVMAAHSEACSARAGRGRTALRYAHKYRHDTIQYGRMRSMNHHHQHCSDTVAVIKESPPPPPHRHDQRITLNTAPTRPTNHPQHRTDTTNESPSTPHRHDQRITLNTAPTRPTNHPQHRPDGCTDACRGPKKRPGCWGATQSVAGSRPPGRRHCACSFLGRHRCPSALGPVLRPPRALASRAAGHSSSHMPSLETGWTIVIMCNQSSTIHRLNAGTYDQTKNGGLIAPIQDSHQTSPCL